MSFSTKYIVRLLGGEKMQGIMFKENLFTAVVNGTKTQTRRIVPDKEIVESEMGKPEVLAFLASGRAKYKVGEVVYLKEPYGLDLFNESIWYKFDHPDKKLWSGPWKNKLFMPAKYARYFIKITEVRVERLQDISHADALKEGLYYNSDLSTVSCFCSEDLPHCGDGLICNDGFFDNPRDAFFSLWQAINGTQSYNNNPWLFVYTFELTDKPL